MLKASSARAARAASSAASARARASASACFSAMSVTISSETRSFSADGGLGAPDPRIDGGGEPSEPAPGDLHADGAMRAPRDAPRSGDRGTARSRRADVDGLETKTSAWPPSAGGTADLATSESVTHPVSVTRRPARRPKADAGSPVSSRRRRVVRARCSAGTVWYFRSSIRKVISGRRDPAAVPAGSVEAAGSRCIVKVRGSFAERGKTETTNNLG